MLTSILLSLVSLMCGATPPAVTVHLDMNDPGKPFAKDLLGVNIDTEDSLEPNSRLDRYYESLGPLQTPVVRFPGGLLANSYHWVQTLGPLAQRKPQWNWDHTRTFPPVCGAGEYLKLLQRMKARGMIIVNVCDGTVEEAVAWLAFCRGRLGDKRVIGKDKNGVDWKDVDYWAKKRLAETGILEPVDVLYWELGNEAVGGPKFNGKEYSTAAEYCPVVREFARAMRRIDPNVFLGWLAWDDKTMGKEKDLLDFIIIHNYTGWPRYGEKIMMWKADTLTGTFTCPESGEYTVELKLASNGVTPEVIKANKIPQVKIGIDDKVFKTMTLQPNFEVVRLNATLTAGEHRLQVTFTNDYCAPDGIDTNVDVAKAYTVTRNGKTSSFTFPDKDTDFREDLKGVQKMFEDHAAAFNKEFPNAFTAVTEFNRMECACFDLATALYAAEFLRICAQTPRIQTVEIWDACGWNFGIFKSCAGKRRPVYYTYMLMKDLLDRQIPISGLPADGPIRILATRNSIGSEVAILIINLEAQPRQIKFTLPAGVKLIGQQRKMIAGKQLNLDNELSEQVPLISNPLAGEVGTVDVPGYSLTLISGKSAR